MSEIPRIPTASATTVAAGGITCDDDLRVKEMPMAASEVDDDFTLTGFRAWLAARLSEQANQGPFHEAQRWTTVEIEARRNLLWDLRSIQAGAGLTEKTAKEYLTAVITAAERLLTTFP